MKILHNARIHTLDSKRPLASVLVIDGERILAIGGDELLREFDNAEKQDMRGLVILPGLTDAHIHLQYYSLGLQKIDCETDMLEECLKRVAERVKKSKPGEWILGHGWNQNPWGRWPTASDLDSIAPNNPVYLTAKSLHAALANSAALKIANITASTPDPTNGQIQRQLNGDPTGVLLESAMDLITRVNPESTSR